MHFVIDAGDRTYLPVCDCGRRGEIWTDRGRALADALAHERRAHPGDEDARVRLATYRAQHAS